MRVALVSRDEVHPIRGGGIGVYVTALAQALSRIAEVTIFTTSLLAPEYDRLRAAEDPRLPPAELVFVEEPSVVEAGGWYHVMHCYSDRVWGALREVYGDRPPDVIEFADYLGEGFVTLQAAWTLDPWLANTRICVRAHTTTELGELLNGYRKPDLPSRVVHGLERFCLWGADRVLWAGGDVWGSYRRLYGVGGLGVGVRVRHPFVGEVGGVSGRVGEGLRLLYVGRLETRKGVVGLVEAVLGCGREDVGLTLVGGDTDSGSLGESVAERLAGLVGGDERVSVVGELPRGELSGVVAAHDVVVVPSVWECWPYVVLEALFAGRPVLASPVGGLVEMVGGGGGWLTDGVGVDACREGVLRLAASREVVAERVASGELVRWAESLCDERAILDGYEGLVGCEVARPLARVGSVARRRDRVPLVSVVVPYFRAARYVAQAVESVGWQSYRRLELVVVMDGSFADEDWVVGELSARVPVRVVVGANLGLGAARNRGIACARGRYVLPLDADNVIEPEFVARCVEVLEARPEVGYVTSWSRYVADDGLPLGRAAVGYQPLGNVSELVGSENVAGDACAVVRRRLFEVGHAYSEELTSYEDWGFYRQLRQAGCPGVVIPQRLMRYRVREDSMQAQIAQPNRPRLLTELDAHIRENAMQWTSKSA